MSGEVLTQKEQKALTLLQDEHARIKQIYSNLMGQVQAYMDQFEELPNVEVIAHAMKDARFDRDVLSPTLASSSLVALQEWKQQELGITAVERHALRLQKVIATLQGLDEM